MSLPACSIGSAPRSVQLQCEVRRRGHPVKRSRVRCRGVGVGSAVPHPSPPLRAHAMLTAPLSIQRHRLPWALMDAPGTRQEIFIHRSLPWQRWFVGFVVGWDCGGTHCCMSVSGACQREQIVFWASSSAPRGRPGVGMEAFPCSLLN